MRKLGILALLGVAGAAGAVVVPNSAAGTDADGTFALTSTAVAGRTFQLVIAANQLTSLVNNNLTGMRFRLNNTVTAGWPSVATNFADWEIRIGAGVTPGTMSNTFAANFTGGNTLVRDGAMSFGVNAFTVGGNPNAFGTALTFNQTAYLYTGGDLCIEMRFSGQTGATNQPTLDAVLASGGPANGWGVNYAARWTSSMTGVTGGNGNFLVTDLMGTPVPEPATMAILGLGAVAAMRRRRK